MPIPVDLDINTPYTPAVESYLGKGVDAKKFVLNMGSQHVAFMDKSAMTQGMNRDDTSPRRKVGSFHSPTLSYTRVWPCSFVSAASLV